MSGLQRLKAIYSTALILFMKKLDIITFFMGNLMMMLIH